MRDVAYVSDGFSPQINIVRMDGQRGVLVTVYKTGNASTLDIVSNIYAKLPQIASLLPPQLVITPLFDQSIFVRAADAGRDSRRPDRRLPHRPDDPAVPGQLAQHADHRHFHSAFHIRLDPVC